MISYLTFVRTIISNFKFLVAAWATTGIAATTGTTAGVAAAVGREGDRRAAADGRGREGKTIEDSRAATGGDTGLEGCGAAGGNDEGR